MKTYKLLHADLVVSRIAYGIGMLGLDWRGSDIIAKSVKAIYAAFESGITFFDTADVYAEGQSEAALGEVLKQSPGLREKLVIQSKCGIRIGGGWIPGDPIGPESLGVDLSYEHIVSAVEGSLKRLGTDRLDVLLLHSPSALVEFEEVALAFDKLKSSGKVLYFGTCGHSAVQIELLRKHIRQPLIANQIWLSLAHHVAISENSGFGGLVDYCRLHDIQIQAFSPLKGVSIFDKPNLLSPLADITPEMMRLAQTLADVAKTYAATPAAIMLAWLLRHPVGIVPIIGSSRPEHIIENCAADRIDLSGDEWRILLEATARRR